MKSALSSARRRGLGSFLLALFTAFAVLPLQAAAKEGAGPIRIVVPFAPGGAQDVIARQLAARLADRLGTPVIVDNRAGAGGVIAIEFVAKAPPDGNTLLLATGGSVSIAPHLMPKLPYDPRRDFASIALVADTPMTLAVRSQSPYQSLADVLRDARARPGQISFASTGNGTVSHLTGELMAQTAGVQLLHVPYKGAGPAMTDLLGGQVDLLVTSVASIDPMVQTGKARVLASFTATRLPTLHGAPTIAEASGTKGLEVPVWVGLLAPARTHPSVVEKLSADVLAVCAQTETQDRFKALGAVPACGGPKVLDKVIADDFQRWAKVIQRGSIKAE